MITPMLKYQMLVYHRDLNKFLQGLRRLGIAHMEVRIADEDGPDDERLRNYRRLTERYHWIAGFRPITDSDETPLTVEFLVREIDEIRERMADLEKMTRETKLRWQVLEPWGEIPAAILDTLQDHGIFTYFFSCPSSAFDRSWKDRYALEIIRQGKQMVHFVILSDQVVPPDIPANLLELRETYIKELASAQQANQLEHEMLDKRCRILAASSGLLQDELIRLEEEMEWKNVINGTQEVAEGKLHVITCWVPEEISGDLSGFLDRTNTPWMVFKPKSDEQVPILLKNDRFSKLFHPIGELFSLPSYNELDLTPFFAPFFTLFFGMCLGDVGYGLIILFALTILKWSGKLPALKKTLTLGQFLGASAVIFGALTGTVFGADLSKLSASWLEVLQPRFLTVDELFNLSLIIGLTQILFGMGLRVWNRGRMYGWQYGLSSAGWILAITGGIFRMGLGWDLAGLLCIIAGLILILFFSDPGRGVLGRLGLGLWDLYGITGLFGDVLSYVRLFALGLSSGILGLVVNNISFSLLESGSILGVVFFVIVLLFGHGLNFAISTLSAFVHPIRLTFVEFYKNAGFIGGGIPYSPFIKKQIKTES